MPRQGRGDHPDYGGLEQEALAGAAAYSHDMRVAAVQLDVALGDVTANLDACEQLARAAADGGAEAIALPEFFTTGAAFLPSVAEAALAPDGAATTMLVRVAREASVLIGGGGPSPAPPAAGGEAFLP